jgi:tRNA modification GTPase
VDTAGFRDTADKVEQMGIEVSQSYLQRAHVILACGDSTASIKRTLMALDGKSAVSTLHVRTKADLFPDEPEASGNVRVSAETGAGLKELLHLIDQSLSDTVGAAVTEVPVLTRARHIRAIKEARKELAMFDEMWKTTNLPAPVAAVHLQTATAALESLVGVIGTDDVLDRVFSSFCVGK